MIRDHQILTNDYKKQYKIKRIAKKVKPKNIL